MKIKFHTFNLSDVEDPEIYAAAPIWDWQQTKKGQWAMNNAHDLTYTIIPDPNHYGYRVDIVGNISDDRIITEYYLRFNHND